MHKPSNLEPLNPKPETQTPKLAFGGSALEPSGLVKPAKLSGSGFQSGDTPLKENIINYC